MLCGVFMFTNYLQYLSTKSSLQSYLNILARAHVYKYIEGGMAHAGHRSGTSRAHTKNVLGSITHNYSITWNTLYGSYTAIRDSHCIKY